MSAHPHDALPIRLNVDDNDSPADVVDALFLGRFATGEQPYSHAVNIERVRSGATLLPAQARVLRLAKDDDRSATLAEGDGWTLLISRWSRGADVTVTATSADLAERIVEEATDGAADEPEPQPENVTMGFWYVSPRRGPHRTTRQITAGTWEEIRPNYTAAVADAMDRLMKTTPRTSRGGCSCCTARRAPARRPRCARSPAPGATGARWTASWTPSGSSPTSAT
nr:DUF5925 domain-containing protein [Actinospica acidiphila]